MIKNRKMLTTHNLAGDYPWGRLKEACTQEAPKDSIIASLFRPSLRKRKKWIERDLRASRRLLVDVTIDVCDVKSGIFSVTCKDLSEVVKQSTITPDGFYEGENKVAIDANKESELHSWAALRDIVLLHIPEMRQLWKTTEPSNLRSALFSGNGSSQRQPRQLSLFSPQPR